MSADTATNTTGRTAIRAVYGAIVIGALLLAGGPLGSDTVASANSVDDVSASASTCADVEDVYRLAEPGSYSAFATTSTGAPVVEVQRLDGEVLATSHATVGKPLMVDLMTGARFGVVPPPVFTVQTSVLIHVRHDGSPYELVVVRVDGGQAWSGLDIHPPVEKVVSASDSCLVGDRAETMRLRTDGVYSDVGARQVFRIASPTPPACGNGRHIFTAIFVNAFGCRQSPRFTLAALTPAEMIITPVMGL